MKVYELAFTPKQNMKMIHSLGTYGALHEKPASIDERVN
jgi:hypothetical protein